MEAVLYCIRELQKISGNSPTLNEKIPAQRAYETGAAYVREKTEKALEMYNRTLPEFCHYENRCLYDTFVKEMPEFFEWYDIRFEPQNTILTLDYPVLKDISGYTGIDKIFEFIKAVRLEQKFLNPLPESFVINVLSENNRNWKVSIENICEPVLTYVIGRIRPEKSSVEAALKILIRKYYGDDRELLHYLSNAVSGIIIK